MNPEACGVTGCYETDDVEIVHRSDGEYRAVCPRHAPGWKESP